MVQRFLSVDPLAGDFANWSPYHYVHNNPINLIDPMGMDTSFASNRQRQQYMESRNELTTRIDEIYFNDKWSDSKKKRKARGYEKALGRFEAIENSEQVFHFEEDTREATFGGLYSQLDSEGRVVIVLNSSASSDEVFHEIVHGNQVLSGELWFDDSGSLQGYDQTDEIQAFTEQWDYAGLIGRTPQFVGHFYKTQPGLIISNTDIIKRTVKQNYKRYPNGPIRKQ